MHRPVGARFAIFARPVDRIDDPYPALVQPRRIVLFLFGKQAIVWPGFPQGVDKELVGGLVTRLAQRLGAEHAAVAYLQKDATGDLRKVSGEFRVAQCLEIDGRGHGISLATMASAASSGVMAMVSMWISGSSGAS